jgi:serralysin
VSGATLSGRNYFDGGSGNDTIKFYDNATASATFVDLGNAYAVTLTTGTVQTVRNVENASMSAFDDIAYGSSDSNVLDGYWGDDVLKGFGGRDTLIGGRGDDTLNGGADADTFVFDDGWGNDVIEDFQAGVDLIDLSDVRGVSDMSDVGIRSVYEQAVGGQFTFVGTEISVGNDTILLEDVRSFSLSSSDFIF